MMNFIGIDPGDRWSGVASLRIDRSTKRTTLRLRSFVVDGEGDIYRAVPFIASLMFEDHVELAVESFRSRPVGHQSWKTPDTAKLIGAIEWTARELDVATNFYPPGKARQHLEGLKVSTILADWADHWPKGKWNHAWSAWRILTIHLLRHNVTWLAAIREMTHKNVVNSSLDLPRVTASPALRGRLPASFDETAYEAAASTDPHLWRPRPFEG